MPTFITGITGRPFTQTTPASAATETPTGDAQRNQCIITSLGTGATIAAPSGTAVDGNTLLLRIEDNGTARALTWNATYKAFTGIALPTTTTVSKTLYVSAVYNAAKTRWDVVSINQEP